MALDLDHLLRLHLAVARFGEMDAAHWWNTKGLLGRLGAIAWPRNFPRTHADSVHRARAIPIPIQSSTPLGADRCRRARHTPLSTRLRLEHLLYTFQPSAGNMAVARRVRRAR